MIYRVYGLVVVAALSSLAASEMRASELSRGAWRLPGIDELTEPNPGPPPRASTAPASPDPSIPEEVVARIKAGHVKKYQDYCLSRPFPQIGMLDSEISSTQFGRPLKKNISVTVGHRREQWVFSVASNDCMIYIIPGESRDSWMYTRAYLYFEDGVLVGIQY